MATRKRTRMRGQPAGVTWDAQPLGVEADAAIARRLGVAARSVWAARRRRGIAAPPRAARRPDVPWAELPLGAVPDTALAAQYGVSARAVRARRLRAGLAACPLRRRQP
jgi:hypothetical protein